MTRKAPKFNELPQGVTICAWCEEYEARAVKAEAAAKDTEWRVRQERSERLQDVLRQNEDLREFFCWWMEEPSRGQSARAMLRFAFEYGTYPTEDEFPSDRDDLRRCEEVLGRLPWGIRQNAERVLSRYREALDA